MEFWEWLVVLFIYIPLFFVWVFAVCDIFQRVDLSGWAKALWVILVLILPLIGMLIYFIARPVTEHDIAVQKQVKENQEYYRTAQATEQLYALQKMLESGQISQDKFDKRKAKIIANMR